MTVSQRPVPGTVAFSKAAFLGPGLFTLVCRGALLVLSYGLRAGRFGGVLYEFNSTIHLPSSRLSQGAVS